MRTVVSQFAASTTPGITNAFSGAGAVPIVALSPLFNGCFIGSLYISVTSIASSASSLIWTITTDVAGDNPIVPLTSSKITVGQTTATSGRAVASINQLLPALTSITSTSGAITLYLWVKTSTSDGETTGTGSGTATLSKAYLSYEAAMAN